MPTTKQFGRAVLIGLGGTGQKALVRIKKMFIDRCGLVPPCIRFLAFDTDSNRDEVYAANGETVTLNEDEFCHLRVNLVRAAVQNPFVQRWWIPYRKLENIAISDGAGGIREAGRLALFENIDVVTSRIKKALLSVNKFDIKRPIKEAGLEYLDMSPQVVVIGSFAGGTGSGTFFDISILCRYLGGEEFKYLAYFVMPSVYRDLANTGDENTYASLIELDHLTLSSSERPFEVQYAHNLSYVLRECPFHVINLVDSRCEDGSLIETPKDLIEFIAESAYNLTGAIGREAKTVGDNILAMKNSVPPEAWSNKGATAIYSTIGCSAIYYPAREIHSFKSYLTTAAILRMIAAADAGAGAQEAQPQSIESIIAACELGPELGLIGKKLLPDDLRQKGRIGFDDDAFEDDSAEEVRGDISSQQDRILEETSKCLGTSASEIRDEAKRRLDELLGLTWQKQTKREFPTGTHAATLRTALEFFEDCESKITGQLKANETELATAEEAFNRAMEQLAQKKSIWFLGKGARLKCAARCYASSNVYLKLLVDKNALQQARGLYEHLAKFVRQKQTDLEGEKSESARYGVKLDQLARDYESRAANLSPSVIKSHESKFEYYVGIEKLKATDDHPGFSKRVGHQGWYWLNKPLEEPPELFKKIETTGGLEDSDQTEIIYQGVPSLLHLPPEMVGEAVLHFVRKQYQPMLDFSVLDVLREMDKQKPGEMKWIVQNAIENSKLLLKLKPQNAPAHQKYLREFTVFAMGHLSQQQVSKDRQELGSHIPEDEKLHNLSANTQDPYRISFSRFYAAFPAFDIEGIEGIRAAYNERVNPPAHLDKNLLFEMDDLLPQDSREANALKLLTLSMLDCFDLLKQVRKPTGGSFYKPDPELEPACLKTHDPERKLPGQPGKFYSLVSALAEPRHDKLTERIKTLLSDRVNQPDFLKLFFSSVSRRHEEIEAILQNMQIGAREKNLQIPEAGGYRQVKGVFNKTITGIYYTREKRFLDAMIDKKEFLQTEVGKAGAEGNLITLLLNPQNGFDI
jgi:hypothetical protein